MTDGRPREIDDVELDMRALFAALGRALPWLVAFVLVVAIALFFGLSLVTPRYTAEAKLLIERGESAITQNAGDTEEARALLDAEGVASQVQLIGSRDLAETVVKQLGLADLPEFNQPSLIGRFDQMLAGFGIGALSGPATTDERVFQRFADRLSVYSVDKTRVITIDFSSSDPALAARIANAVADQYLALDRDAKRASNADATTWLEAQIADLRVKVTDAEAKVETFRTGSDLFLGGQNNNQSLSQQKLTDLNAELARVQAVRAAAEAKAATVRKGLSNDTAFDMPDVLSSPLIQRLLEQQVSLRAQIAQLSATLLPAHPRIRELNAQLADLDAQVKRETGRILKSIEAEAATARASEAEINADLARAKTVAGQSNDAEVQLRALEREATAERDLLETYLRRYREATSRQAGDYLPADARVISRAATPLEPSFPRRIPITAAATTALLLLALVFVLVRELASGRALRRIVFDGSPQAPAPLPSGERSGRSDTAPTPLHAVPSDPSLAGLVAVDDRDSLRAIVDRITAAKAKRVILAPAKSEAASRPLAAVALARQLSRRGSRVLLVDLHADAADGKAMAMVDEITPGLFDLFAGAASFTEVIFRDRRSRAHVIPRGTATLSSDMAASPRFATILDALDHTYDHILIDAAGEMAGALAPTAGAVVVVADADEAEPAALPGYAAMAAVSPVEIMLLIADMPPLADEPDPETQAA
ncbi:exopolysaccharide transport family protein [Kaistia dalseonensis]|uniref:Uncharacterized protein involved in exopolysaccharide biosynthesis/Mrp family chromosome partitioning ATPase n=1 Tax=Kaistia dalseonensis TaxID=410840 RepID=A0ABU0H1L7_9HYPH|nr:exopolysaccharide transport family protein [Kaistia dalseonensis]MCX5493642.1 exopolysaccharide transport family protein [Kaistia dalseonensis]MDQ0436204.1 uncharacterized protein involved in exopolysaccharide biosynthesis/Mrp family chromosome partitioning ATPase [Kaistia dalseonensis]